MNRPDDFGFWSPRDDEAYPSMSPHNTFGDEANTGWRQDVNACGQRELYESNHNAPRNSSEGIFMGDSYGTRGTYATVPGNELLQLNIGARSFSSPHQTHSPSSWTSEQAPRDIVQPRASTTHQPMSTAYDGATWRAAFRLDTRQSQIPCWNVCGSHLAQTLPEGMTHSYIPTIPRNVSRSILQHNSFNEISTFHHQGENTCENPRTTFPSSIPGGVYNQNTPLSEQAAVFCQRCMYSHATSGFMCAPDYTDPSSGFDSCQNLSPYLHQSNAQSASPNPSCSNIATSRVPSDPKEHYVKESCRRGCGQEFKGHVAGDVRHNRKRHEAYSCPLRQTLLPPLICRGWSCSRIFRRDDSRRAHELRHHHHEGLPPPSRTKRGKLG